MKDLGQKIDIMFLFFLFLVNDLLFQFSLMLLFILNHLSNSEFKFIKIETHFRIYSNTNSELKLIDLDYIDNMIYTFIAIFLTN